MKKGDIVQYKDGCIDYDNLDSVIAGITLKYPMIVLCKLNTEIISDKIIPICKVISLNGKIKWVMASKLDIVSRL